MPSQQDHFLSCPTDGHGAARELQVDNHKSSVPSRQMTPPVSFYNLQNLPFRYVPGTRMINIPPPQNYPTVDDIARPPSPYVNYQASMPMSPLTGFGEPFGRPMIDRKCLQSRLMERAALSPGRRHNKTTVSAFPEFALQQTTRSRAATNEGIKEPTHVYALTPNVEERMSDHEKSMSSKLESQIFESSNPRDNCEATMLELLTSHNDDLPVLPTRNALFSSSPRKKEDTAAIVSTRAQSRNSSTDSGSTVASDSWNTMTSSKVLEDRPLMGYTQTTPKQKTYLLDQHVQGSPEHEIKVYDFAHSSGPAKAVRFSSHSDNKPSVKNRSVSNSSESSSQMLIDLGEYRESQGEGSAAHADDEAVSCEDDDAFLLPATTYRPLSVDQHKPTDASDDEDPFRSASHDRLIPSKNGDRAKQLPKKCNSSGPLEILSRASESISNVAAAHAGMTPPAIHKTGFMERDFQFPARSAEQRFSSVPNLSSGATKTAEVSKHSKSFSRVLGGFGSKKKGGKKNGDANEENEGTDEEKSRASLACRISKRVGDFVVRKGW